MLTIIEKVLFLQDVDIFEHTSTEDLSHIAAITEELTFSAEHTIFKEGDPADSMYLITDGQIKITRQGQTVMLASTKDVFGTWALFDDEPRLVTAKTVQESHLLRIDRDDFYDLLSDHINITQGVLKMLSKRLRRLVS